MEQPDRDLLIRLDTKVDEINQKVTDLKSSQNAQWAIIDSHTSKLATHDENLRSLNKILWWVLMILFGGSGGVGLIFYLMRQ